jgi:hypothetical protein
MEIRVAIQQNFYPHFGDMTLSVEGQPRSEGDKDEACRAVDP